MREREQRNGSHPGQYVTSKLFLIPRVVRYVGMDWIRTAYLLCQ